MENMRIQGMIDSLPDPIEMYKVTQTIDAALTAIKYGAYGDRTTQRVLIQELAAALNRRKILANDKVEKFWDTAEDYIGYEEGARCTVPKQYFVNKKNFSKLL